ncbi:hypothetical protein PTKIN_Ptkin14bG0210900 [Pterospermum kingtungense]
MLGSLLVKYSGSGISPQDIPKLFTKFAQTQSTATRNSGGSGLGLVRERLNESKLSFMPKVLTNRGPTAFLGLKVPAMDENGVSRMMTKGLLVHLGCDVTMVSSSEECLLVVSHEHKETELTPEQCLLL